MLIGIDVGLSFIEPTTGVCRTGDDSTFIVDHVYADRASRLAALGIRKGDRPFDLVAIDGPLLSGLGAVHGRRTCERVFVCGPFQRRCKPGESHVRGTGQALSRAATETARQVVELTAGPRPDMACPWIVADKAIIEAFPNAFLGVLLPDEAFEGIPKGRGKKFDALFEAVRSRAVLWRLLDELGWSDGRLRDALATNTQHDERAALICALTAVCAWRGRYTAVGDEEGGWFFLPSWEHWQPWARRAIESSDAEVWRDGVTRPR